MSSPAQKNNIEPHRFASRQRWQVDKTGKQMDTRERAGEGRYAEINEIACILNKDTQRNADQESLEENVVVLDVLSLAKVCNHTYLPKAHTYTEKR